MVCNFWVILWIKLVLTFKGEGRGQPSLKQYIFSYFEVVSVNKPGRSVYFNKTNLGWLKDWSFLAILGNFWPFQSFLTIFGSFQGHFWHFCMQFSAILGQLIQCWYSLPNLDHLPKQFRPFQGHIWLFWAILCHFWPIWVMYQSFV